MPALHALHSRRTRLRALARPSLWAAVLLWPALAAATSIPHEAAEQLQALGDPAQAAVSAPPPERETPPAPEVEAAPAPVVLERGDEAFSPVGWSLAPGLPEVEPRAVPEAGSSPEPAPYRTPAELTLPTR